MASFKDFNAFGIKVQKIAEEELGYSVQADGYCHAEHLIYKMVARGYDVFGMLIAKYEMDN